MIFDPKEPRLHKYIYKITGAPLYRSPFRNYSIFLHRLLIMKTIFDQQDIFDNFYNIKS